MVLGPLTIDQAAVPVVGLFAANVAPAPSQISWGLPALAAVGWALTVMVTLSVDGVQGLFEIVHNKT